MKKWNTAPPAGTRWAMGRAGAYLYAAAQPLVNRFTAARLEIQLEEPLWQPGSKLVPGLFVRKDPTVTVGAGSEECYVFVKITEENNTLSNSRGKFVDYTVANTWTALDGVPGVYYYNTTVTATDADVKLQVLVKNEVSFNENIEQSDMDAITADTTKAPKLNFVAYAVQAEGSKDAAEAWAKIG